MIVIDMPAMTGRDVGLADGAPRALGRKQLIPLQRREIESAEHRSPVAYPSLLRRPRSVMLRLGALDNIGIQPPVFTSVCVMTGLAVRIGPARKLVQGLDQFTLGAFLFLTHSPILA
jgi:hypothetical protein